MREIGLPFMAPLVLRILAGAKTQTRRPVRRGQPRIEVGDTIWVRETFWCINDTDTPECAPTIDCGSCLSLGPSIAEIQYVASPGCLCPPKTESAQTVEPHEGPPVPGYWWLAPPNHWDGEDETSRRANGAWMFIPWEYHTKHPSLHMPRWASRIDLSVTEVREERLQEIADSPEDLLSEGMVAVTESAEHLAFEFRESWDKAYAGRGAGWDANPAVRVISFRRIKP